MKYPWEIMRKMELVIIRYYRDYDSGLIKGYVLIEYQSPLLINNFAHIRYGETGSYLIADTDGNKKIENDQDVSGNIRKKSIFNGLKIIKRRKSIQD